MTLLAKFGIAVNVLPYYCLPLLWPRLMLVLCRDTNEMYKRYPAAWDKLGEELSSKYLNRIIKYYKFRKQVKVPERIFLSFCFAWLHEQFNTKLINCKLPSIDHMGFLMDFSLCNPQRKLLDHICRNNLPEKMNKATIVLSPTKSVIFGKVLSHLGMILTRVQSQVFVVNLLTTHHIIFPLLEASSRVRCFTMLQTERTVPVFKLGTIREDIDYQIEEFTLVHCNLKRHYYSKKLWVSILSNLCRTNLKKSLKKFTTSFWRQEKLQSLLVEYGFENWQACYITPKEHREKAISLARFDLIPHVRYST